MYAKMMLVAVVVVTPMFLPNCHNQLTPRLDGKRDSLERDSRAEEKRLRELQLEMGFDIKRPRR